jgi:isopentenyl phosphate kinase
MATSCASENVMIIKLGGAILTDKRSTCTLASSSQLDSIFRQVLFTYQHSSRKLIVIHGVGSFGHPQAKEYSVKNGTLKDKEKDVRKGLCLTRVAVLRLHAHVINSLTDLGLPVVSVSPFDHVITNGGVDESTSSSYNHLCRRTQELLEQGFVPVLHGDAVLDDKQSCTILSGDVVMRVLARSISHTSRCIFLTDVEGVFDKDPKTHKDAQLIHELAISHEISHPHTANGVADVTGSMHGKMKWARLIVRDLPGKVDVVVCGQGTEASKLAMSGSAITTSTRLTIIR